MTALRHACATLTCLMMVGSIGAQSVWTNAGADYSFSNPDNWSPTVVPGSGDALVIASDDLVGVDVGGNYTAGTLTIAEGIMASFLPAGAETLTVTHGLLNLGLGAIFELPLLLDGDQTWNFGGGDFHANSALNVLSGTATFSFVTGSSFTFGGATNNPDWSGWIAVVGDVTQTSLPVSGAGLTAQNISRISINGLPAYLDGGFLLAPAAVPEPGVSATLLGAVGIAFALWRRRSTGPRS